MNRVLIPLVVARRPGANKLDKTPVRGCNWREPDFWATPEQWSHSNGAAIRLDGLTVLDIDDPTLAPPWLMDAYHELDTLKYETPNGWHAYFEGEATPSAFGLYTPEGYKFADVLSTAARFVAFQAEFRGRECYIKQGDRDSLLPLEELKPLVMPFAVNSPVDASASSRDVLGVKLSDGRRRDLHWVVNRWIDDGCWDPEILEPMLRLRIAGCYEATQDRPAPTEADIKSTVASALKRRRKAIQ